MIPIAFYAPLKSPDHAVPSGDRTMGRLLRSALRQAGLEPELASELRSLDIAGDSTVQSAIKTASEDEADELIEAFRTRPAAERPRLWFTYHCHYKAPDWIGPRVAAALRIPYVVAEGSRSARRARGPWALGHIGAEAALDAAERLFVINPADEEDLVPALRTGQELVTLPPFLDASAWPEPTLRRDACHGPLRLLTVAMMRDGEKLSSYRLLADALARLPASMTWTLDIVGDGPAAATIAEMFAPFGARVSRHGLVHERARLIAFYGAADLLVWPAFGEAYGMTLLEAQVCGCPILAGREGGVPAVVMDGETGLLVAPRDAEAFAEGLLRAAQSRDDLSRMGERARHFVREERDVGHAAAILHEALGPLLEGSAFAPSPSGRDQPVALLAKRGPLRILIAVTHLLGAGHLMRASAIGRALASRGHEVTLVSGGAPVSLAAIDGLDFVQLPPVRSRVGQFSTLLDPGGRPASATHLEARRQLLVSTFHRVRPAVVVTEHFPFGRRSLQAEFRALLDAAAAARPAPLLLGSIRDILVAPVKPEKIERAHALVAHRYAAILVHGDEAAIPLDRSWPVDDALRAKLTYTGYIGAQDAPLPPARAEAAKTILVSGGSSAAALPLYRAALAAARESPARSWRILVGLGVDEADFQRLAEDAASHVVVERARRDFRALLARASVFVGQAGYNTVMDIVATRARAVLVPFEEGGETEQRLRAESLEGKGFATVLLESALTPVALRAAIAAAEARPRPVFDIALDGQERSARVIENLAAARHAVAPAEAAQ